MKHKVTDKEQIKADKFFHKLYDKSVQKGVLWFVNGIFIFLIMILCLMPIQELWGDLENDPWLISGVLTMFSTFMTVTRTSLYSNFTENQKRRMMKEFLQYHPISKKAVWKYKMMDLLPFLAKVTGVGLLLQLIATFIAYKTVSWINVVYVLICVFFCPVLCELVTDVIMRNYAED